MTTTFKKHITLEFGDKIFFNNNKEKLSNYKSWIIEMEGECNFSNEEMKDELSFFNNSEKNNKPTTKKYKIV